MRKAISILTLASFVGLMLAGCGPKLTEQEKTAPPPAGPRGYTPPPAGATGGGAPPGAPTGQPQTPPPTPPGPGG